MNDRKREGLRITLKILFPSNWKDGVPLFGDGEDKKGAGLKIRISKLNTLRLRCPLNVQVEIGNRTDKQAGQERGYRRAKRTKAKSQAS